MVTETLNLKIGSISSNLPGCSSGWPGTFQMATQEGGPGSAWLYSGAVADVMPSGKCLGTSAFVMLATRLAKQSKAGRLQWSEHGKKHAGCQLKSSLSVATTALQRGSSPEQGHLLDNCTIQGCLLWLASPNSSHGDGTSCVTAKC